MWQIKMYCNRIIVLGNLLVEAFLSHQQNEDGCNQSNRFLILILENKASKKKFKVFVLNLVTVALLLYLCVQQMLDDFLHCKSFRCDLLYIGPHTRRNNTFWVLQNRKVNPRTSFVLHQLPLFTVKVFFQLHFQYVLSFHSFAKVEIAIVCYVLARANNRSKFYVFLRHVGDLPHRNFFFSFF